MGENNTYTVNDDGSVTVAAQLSEQEQNIIEILRIERSKGGIFASRRMKKRAIKYAQSVGYPDFKVDKLMLDNYPDDFANYPRTTHLIIWLSVTVLFFIGAICFIPLSYDYFGFVSEQNRQITAIEEYQRTGDVETYYSTMGWGMSADGNYRIPAEQLERELSELREQRNSYLKDLLLWSLLGVGGCLAISFISLKRCMRIAGQVKPKS